MCESKFLKIAYSVVASLVAFAVVINVVSVPVSAAEVESLPAYDIGITSSYDDDYVYVNDNGSTYSIPRNTVASGVVGNSYPWSMPYTLEVCGLGYSCPVSYWYSPEHKCIVVISSSRTVGNENTTKVGNLSYSYKVGAYSDGSFWMFSEKTGSISVSGSLGYMVIYDCVNNTVIRSKSLFDSKSTSIKHYYCDAIDRNGVVYDDLVCVYSSYEIEGFYGGNDDVITPDYYFDYQYLFYTEQKGYVFVDSSKPLDYISNSNDPTKAVLYFDDKCNKHIYTSELGNSWISDNSISSIYGNRYTMDYSYFYDGVGGQSCYVLVYSNDDGYKEEPLATPEFGTIEDITDNLNNFILEGAPLPSGGRNNENYSFDDLLLLTAIDYYDFISYGFTHEYYMKYVITYDDGFEETVFVTDTGRHGSIGSGGRTSGSLSREKIPTIACYLYDVNMSIDDFISLYKLYSEAMHMDMKAIFDNITNTNTYLYDIKGLIQDMPDYSKSFDKLVNVGFTNNQLLENINNNILALGSGSGEASPDIGGGSSSTTNNNITQDFLVTLDDDMLVYLNDIKNISNKIYDEVDESIGEKISDELIDNTIDGLFDDLADEDIFADLFNDDFVQGAVSSIATGTLVSGQFANITSSGASGAVPWINANVTAVYNAVGFKVQSVVLLGAAMFLVNIVVRKGV